MSRSGRVSSGSVRSLALGYHGCFVLSSNFIECTSRLSDDALTNVKDVSIAGPLCALLTNGNVHCWGENSYGSLGDSTHNTRFDKGPPILHGAVAIATKSGHACAILQSGQLSCRGYNGAGELGDGTTIHRAAPVPGPTFCP